MSIFHGTEPVTLAPPSRLGGEVGHLPTLPIVGARLLQFYSSEDYSVDEVVAALESDPPISGRVLRLANSAYYGFSRQVERLHHGVVLLGGVTVQSIALSATVLRKWARNAPPGTVREIWVHACLCGAGCRYLGCRLPASPDLPSPDALYMIGLFHDVGKIFYLARAPDSYVGLLENLSGVELRAAERDQFGQDHAEMSGDLLEAWGLPSRMVNVVRHHHCGELRAELRPALEVIRCIHGLLDEEEAGGVPASDAVPEALRGDVLAHLERERPGAEAFYEAIA
jgi:HD-like signal output (HDOD) protein